MTSVEQKTLIEFVLLCRMCMRGVCLVCCLPACLRRLLWSKHVQRCKQVGHVCVFMDVKELYSHFGPSFREHAVGEAATCSAMFLR